MRKAWMLLLALVALPLGLLAKGEGLEGSTVYLKQNLQVSNKKGYSTHFTSLPSDVEIWPAGSKVKVLKVARNGFVLEDKEGKVKFEYQARWYDGMSTEEFLERITSSTDPSAKWGSLSAADKAGIKAGKIKVGMSKEGVLIAAGYPPATKTDDIKSDTWVYQRNRFAWITVKFKAGKVVKYGMEE